MFNHNALIQSGSQYSEILESVGGKFNSLSDDETTQGQSYQTLCFQTEQEISNEQEQSLLALPQVYDVGLNQ